WMILHIFGTSDLLGSINQSTSCHTCSTLFTRSLSIGTTKNYLLHGRNISKKFTLLKSVRHNIEEESILFSQDRNYFACAVASVQDSKRQAVSWWEINGAYSYTSEACLVHLIAGVYQWCSRAYLEHLRRHSHQKEKQ
ncbi:hypothetical protein GOP47_0026246, partial [Adiantum capillus-veneris]